MIGPAILLACLPDADVAAFALGIPYASPWGHRGFSHSLAFAALAAIVTALGVRRNSELTAFPARVCGCWILAAASHGLLDALTDGGLGVAFFAPLDNDRYFLPVRPLRVSPIGLRAFFSQWGLTVLLSEFLWVWIPGTAMLLLGHFFGQRRPRPS